MLRGPLALIVLGLFFIAYLIDVIQGAANGTGAPPGTHQAFWGMIGISVLLTFASISLRSRDE